MNDTLQNLISQTNKEKKAKIKAFLSECSYSTRRSLGSIAGLKNKHRDVFASQMVLAFRSGITRTTFNEINKTMEREGLIKTRQFGYYDTLNYHLDPVFNDREFRKELSSLPGLKESFSVPTIWWLIPEDPLFSIKNKSFQSEYPTLINTVGIKNVNYFKTRAHTREEEAHIQREKLISQLTPQQKSDLERLRSGYKTIPVRPLTPLVDIRDWQPETVADLFRQHGFDCSSA